MTPRLSRALIVATALATALVVATTLAGCSTAASPGASQPSGSSAASTSAAPSAHAKFVIPSTCLSASEVQNLLGLPESGPTVTADTGSLICEYLTATQDGAIINYESKPGETPATLAANLTVSPPAGAIMMAIPHLGDAAYEVKVNASDGIVMLAGSTLIDIAGGDTTLPRLESLAVDVLAG